MTDLLTCLIGSADQIADEARVEFSLEVAIEVAGWDRVSRERLQRGTKARPLMPIINQSSAVTEMESPTLDKLASLWPQPMVARAVSRPWKRPLGQLGQVSARGLRRELMASLVPVSIREIVEFLAACCCAPEGRRQV